MTLKGGIHDLFETDWTPTDEDNPNFATPLWTPILVRIEKVLQNNRNPSKRFDLKVFDGKGSFRIYLDSCFRLEQLAQQNIRPGELVWIEQYSRTKLQTAGGKWLNVLIVLKLSNFPSS